MAKFVQCFDVDANKKKWQTKKDEKEKSFKTRFLSTFIVRVKLNIGRIQRRRSYHCKRTHAQPSHKSISTQTNSKWSRITLVQTHRHLPYKMNSIESTNEQLKPKLVLNSIRFEAKRTAFFYIIFAISSFVECHFLQRGFEDFLLASSLPSMRIEM